MLKSSDYLNNVLNTLRDFPVLRNQALNDQLLLRRLEVDKDLLVDRVK